MVNSKATLLRPLCFQARFLMLPCERFISPLLRSCRSVLSWPSCSLGPEAADGGGATLCPCLWSAARLGARAGEPAYRRCVETSSWLALHSEPVRAGAGYDVADVARLREPGAEPERLIAVTEDVRLDPGVP